MHAWGWAMPWSPRRVSSCTRARWPCSSRTAARPLAECAAGRESRRPDAGSRGWRVAAVACAVAIVVFGVLPTQGVVHAIAEGRDDLLTSAGHFASYALLAVVSAVARARARRPRWRRG